MLSAEFLIEYVTLDLLPRKRRMIFQNTFVLPKHSWNPTDHQIFPMTSCISLLPRLQILRFSASELQIDDDLSYSKALNASFFTRIASLTFLFHQGVLFSL